MQLFYFGNQKGFTLLELLISISILVIITLAWNNFSIQSYRSARFGQEQLEAIRQAQKGIDTMAKELRELSVAENGSYPLELAGDQEIIFYSDIDQDVYAEKVRYFIENNELKKGVIEATGNPLTYDSNNEIVQTISSHVRNNELPIFIYYNGDYPYDTINNPLPSPARLVETKLIQVFLRININPLHAPTDFDLQTDIQLRNLKNNL
jgi:prepilin-type N-terminal cleavage/methylation domain-containing protein